MSGSTERIRALCALALGLAVFGCLGCRSARRAGADAPPRIERVRPAVAQRLLRDSPDTPILDLRTPEEFHGEIGHLAGARNLPLDRLALHLEEIAAYRKETFLVYCRADACGEEGMRLLRASGFEDAILIEGGIEAWRAGGFKTVRDGASSGGAGKAPGS